MFAALTKCVLTALKQLMGRISPKADGAVASGSRSNALFKVAAVLSAPEVHVSPPLPEINKVLAKLVKSIVESTRERPGQKREPGWWLLSALWTVGPAVVT